MTYLQLLDLSAHPHDLVGEAQLALAEDRLLGLGLLQPIRLAVALLHQVDQLRLRVNPLALLLCALFIAV